MPIAKGEEWGHPGVLPAGAPVAASDAEAAALITANLGDAAPSTRTIGLSAGDLARTLGIRGPYDAAKPKHVVPVDALRVQLDDGSEYVSIAHVLVGDLRRNRPAAAIMNAAFIGTRNIAPRAHPGDGKADVVRFDLGMADRLKGWKRMVTGTHVPHPGIEIRQRKSGVVELGRVRRIRVDGQAVGRAERVHFQVEPGAILIAVS